MGYVLELDQFLNRMNIAKEMTVLALIKEGLISKEVGQYFMENYAIVEQGHDSLGSRFLKIFKGTDKPGSINFRIMKNIDIWNDNKDGQKLPHAKIVSINKEKDKDAGAERFSDIEDGGDGEGT